MAAPGPEKQTHSRKRKASEDVHSSNAPRTSTLGHSPSSQESNISQAVGGYKGGHNLPPRILVPCTPPRSTGPTRNPSPLSQEAGQKKPPLFKKSRYSIQSVKPPVAVKSQRSGQHKDDAAAQSASAEDKAPPPSSPWEGFADSPKPESDSRQRHQTEPSSPSRQVRQDTQNPVIVVLSDDDSASESWHGFSDDA